MNPWPTSLVAAYLLGSIPFGYLLVRFVLRQDIRTIGSGNIGATNVLRGGKKSLGIATLLLDLGKALAAVMLARHLAPDNFDLAVAAGTVAVFAHCFPVWLGFHGGKGVASALGAFLALSWPSTLCAVAVFLAVVIFTRFVSLASVAAAVTLPLFALYFVSQRTPVVVAGFVLIPLLVVAKHHGNIRRLLAGTESRFGQKVAA